MANKTATTCGSAGRRARTAVEWHELIDPMDRKRPGWIHASEQPLIAQYVIDHYSLKRLLCWPTPRAGRPWTTAEEYNRGRYG